MTGRHDTTRAVAHFLGGFTAAEGTFVRSEVPRPSGPGRPTFTFAVSLGSVDISSCELFRTFLGVGQVRRYPRRKPGNDDEVVFSIRSIPKLLEVVVPFMDEHLPPSHKRQQYLAWREELVSYDEVRRRP